MQTVSSRLSELSRGDLDTRGLFAETQGLRQDNGGAALIVRVCVSE